MKIGKYRLNVINSGFLALDGGAMFGIIPKPLWEKTNPADEVNRIKLATRNLLLKSDDKVILIDTGMGRKWDEKSSKIYDIDQNDFSLDQSLKNEGLKPEDVTDVILTHLHFDHTGGSTKNENGKLIPAFPNAKYHIQKEQFEWAKNPSEKDRGSFIKDNFMPLAEEGVVNFIEGEYSFDNEIKFLPVTGHTFSQQLIKISDSGETLLYCADLLPTAAHIPVPYVMGYDLQPLVTITEKKKILSKAMEENWLLFFEHDPDTVCATVHQTEKGIRIKDKYTEL